MDEFLNKTLTINDMQADRHFRSQTFYLPAAIKKSPGRRDIWTIKQFMESQKKNSAHQEVIKLNANKTPLPPETQIELATNSDFMKRYDTDIQLYNTLKKHCTHCD